MCTDRSKYLTHLVEELASLEVETLSSLKSLMGDDNGCLPIKVGVYEMMCNISDAISHAASDAMKLVTLSYMVLGKKEISPEKIASITKKVGDVNKEWDEVYENLLAQVKLDKDEEPNIDWDQVFQA